MTMLPDWRDWLSKSMLAKPRFRENDWVFGIEAAEKVARSMFAAGIRYALEKYSSDPVDDDESFGGLKALADKIEDGRS